MRHALVASCVILCLLSAFLSSLYAATSQQEEPARCEEDALAGWGGSPSSGVCTPENTPEDLLSFPEEALSSADPILLDFLQHLRQLSPEQRRFLMSPYLPRRDRTPAAEKSPFQESAKLEFWKRACDALCRLRGSPFFSSAALARLLPSLLGAAACPWSLMDPQRLLDGLCSSGAVQRARELRQVYLATVRQASQEAQEMKTGRRAEKKCRTMFQSSLGNQAPAPQRASPLSPSRPQSPSPPSQPTLSSQSASPSFSASPSSAPPLSASSSSSSSLSPFSLFSSWCSASLWLEKAGPVCQRMYTQVDRVAQAAIASVFQKLRQTHGGEGEGSFGSVRTRKRRREDEKKRQLEEETEEGGEYICVAAMEELTAEFVRWLRSSAASREASLLEEEDSLHAEGERTTERTTFLLAEQSLLSFWTTREPAEDSSSSTLPFSVQCFLGYLLSRSSSSSFFSPLSASSSSASASLRASLCVLPTSSIWPAASPSSDRRGEASEDESLSTARGPAAQEGRAGTAWRRLFPWLLRESREARAQDDGGAVGFLKIVKFSFARHSEATITETEKSQALCRYAAQQLKASADRLRDKIAHLRQEALAAARAGDRKTAGHLLRFLKQVEGRRDEVELLLLQLENCLGRQARMRSMSVVADTLAGNEQVLKLHKRNSAALLGVAPETLETAIADTRDAQEKLQRAADAFRVFASPGVPPQTDDALNAELEDLERRALEEKTASLLSTLPAVPHALSPLSLSPRPASPRKVSPFLPRVARLANRKARVEQTERNIPVQRRTNLSCSALRRQVSGYHPQHRKTHVYHPSPRLSKHNQSSLPSALASPPPASLASALRHPPVFIGEGAQECPLGSCG
ncbi:SNF7 family protein [Toxoplasma gondii VEG]|uniref:SNF7 family protein n=1 Tax=Toxoplasma gondii (strain ATCC 50861 / VEG) TaxID=432359 RepID=V5BAQ3_TOXGV|nr:SNF7 family protein [Toxoplasma gondii VEG]